MLSSSFFQYFKEFSNRLTPQIFSPLNLQKTAFQLNQQSIYHQMPLKVSKKVNSNFYSNPNFDSIRSGRLAFSGTNQLGSQNSSFSTSYSTPFANYTVIQCYVALSSFSIPFDLALENRVWVSPQGCTPTDITLSLSASQKNINLVTYIVVSDDLIASQNFVFLPLQNQATIFGQNNPLIDSSQLNGLNTTGQIKHFSFFQGFALQTTNVAPNQTATLQRGFSVVVSQLSATTLNYSILSRGRNTYSGTVSVLLVIYNNDFFNSQNTLHLVGNTESYSNLADAALSVGYSNSASLVLTFVGVSELYANGDLVFSVQGEQSGQLSVHSNGGVNTFKLNYLAFPQKIDEDLQAHKKLLGGNANTNNNTSSENNISNNLTIYLTVVCSVVFFSLVLCCAFYNCKNQVKQSVGEIPNPSSGRLPIATTLTMSPLKIGQVSSQNCRICSNTKVQLATHCKHYFHIRCFKEQRSQPQKCPICNESLLNQKMTVFCRKCQVGYLLGYQQAQLMHPDFGVDAKCQRCKWKAIHGSGVKGTSQKYSLEQSMGRVYQFWEQ